jgi:hypothetical protein
MHESERTKPARWTPFAWMPVYKKELAPNRPTKGFDSHTARRARKCSRTDCQRQQSIGARNEPSALPLGSVSSLLMNSKGEEIVYPVEDDRDRIWARRLEWVVDQHLDRAEDEQNQLQRDVLRQYKQARERKYDQTTISYLSKQLDTARETIWALRRRPFGRLNCCQRAAHLISISISL